VAVRQTPQPGPEPEQLSFDIQTATATVPPVLSLIDESLLTPSPTRTSSPVTATATLTAAAVVTGTQPVTATAAPTPPPVEEAVVATVAPVPTVSPTPAPAVPTVQPLRGGEWDFEAGFSPWANPYGEPCAGSGLANGWSAFTTRDEYGSSCFNQTTWQDNVYSGGSAQEITFAFVGNQAGIYKTAPTVPGHRYTVEAYVRKEFSPAAVQVELGLDVTGNTNWQAETVQWFLWDEGFEDQWAKTEETITATGQGITIFIKGFHPYPEPGGAVRIDSITIVDLGPE